ncbi:MAG: hypothetical protein ABR975_04140 [Vulcanimicrobiaceae bacterium]|jgi:hypothetical protein
MDTHFNAGAGFQAAGAFHHPGYAQASGQAGGSSMITPTILGQGSSASLLNSIDGASTTGSLGTAGSSGASGSSLVNALQGLAQMLLGGSGGSGGSAGSGFTLSLPQYQPMQKANENDTRDIAPSPAGSGGSDE